MGFDLGQLGMKGPPLSTLRVAAGSEMGISAETWRRIAGLHFQNARLDPSSRALLLAKESDGRRCGTARDFEDSGRIAAVSSDAQPGTFDAEDTVRNEYLFHSRIHQWLAEPVTHDVETLNRRIYAELFLTPETDPWLG
jgi:hypothetical protein